MRRSVESLSSAYSESERRLRSAGVPVRAAEYTDEQMAAVNRLYDTGEAYDYSRPEGWRGDGCGVEGVRVVPEGSGVEVPPVLAVRGRTGSRRRLDDDDDAGQGGVQVGGDQTEGGGGRPAKDGTRRAGQMGVAAVLAVGWPDGCRRRPLEEVEVGGRTGLIVGARKVGRKWTFEVHMGVGECVDWTDHSGSKR